jgi:hypothetical protein
MQKDPYQPKLQQPVQQHPQQQQLAYRPPPQQQQGGQPAAYHKLALTTGQAATIGTAQHALAQAVMDKGKAKAVQEGEDDDEDDEDDDDDDDDDDDEDYEDDNEPSYLSISLKRVEHILHDTEYTFKGQDGKLISTVREDWMKKTTEDDQSVWVYSEGGNNYLTYKWPVRKH